MEHQNIEYEQGWRDEYIKGVCGFANATGGKIYIGDDEKGLSSGIENPKKYWKIFQTKQNIFLVLCK